ncbi:hypothetical protein HOY80DRAFT_1046685 [Tuber brumale]|nr:hypothetical protein HOY80DRAFT_1046685 [Tuber brumale]
MVERHFDDYCENRVQELEKKAARSRPITSSVGSLSTTPVIVKEKSHVPPPQPPRPGIMNCPIRVSSDHRGHESATYPSNGEENADEEDPDTVLSYSAPNLNSTGEAAEHGRDGTRMVDYVDQKEWGSKRSKGELALKDPDTEVRAILKESWERSRNWF